MSNQRDVNRMGKEALRQEVIYWRSLISNGDSIPRSEVGAIVSRAIQSYQQQTSRKVNALLKDNGETLRKWHAQYHEFYGLISFISGAALAGRGKMLLAVIGETPETGKDETDEQLRAALEGNSDMIAALSGSYFSLRARAKRIGEETYRIVRDDWGHIVNEYLIGLNSLRNTGNDELLIAAAGRYSEDTEKLRHARAILAPGVKAESGDIKAFTVVSVLASQETYGGTQEESIERYVEDLLKKDKSDFERDVLAEILKSDDYVPEVLKWIQRVRTE